MSRLREALRSERLLPLLAGIAALAVVAVVVVIATGGDEATEPVAMPAAADRTKPAGGDDADKAESDGRKREQDEEPKREEQQPEQETPTPQPEPQVPAATDDGEEPDSGAPKDRGSKDKDKADEVSCAEREKATRGEPELERFLDEWFGPCE